jgi:fatty-acyl-CoA synthase/long-chain acyl-CoA synthetase
MSTSTYSLILEPADLTVGMALDAAARQWTHACGWIFEDRRVSFAEMKDMVDRAAGGLQRLGVTRGHMVATWTPNLMEWAVTSFAAYRLGATVTALNTRFKQFEASHVLAHSRARVLLLQPHFLRIDFEEILGEIAPDLSVAADGRVVSDDLPDLRHLIAVAPGGCLSALPWSELLASAPVDTEALEVELDPQTPALLQYTSGTTARSKGALLTHRHILNYGAEVFVRLGVRHGEAVMNTQPVYHVGGSTAMTMPLRLGCTAVTPTHYDPGRVLELMERERCVSRSGIPTMYLMELEHPRFAQTDLSSLRSGWTGGPPGLMDRIRDAFGGIELVQLYGASEGGGTAGSIEDSWDKRRISAGQLLTDTSIHIVDPDTGDELPAGEVGEVCLGPSWNRMLEYFDDEERTREAFDERDWLHMGDLGRFDEEGYFYYVGRLKDMIRVGGENTSAEEVESLLAEHPEIHQVAVIGVPDDRMGEVVLAIVERAAGSDLPAEAIIAYCRERAANFRVPRHVRFVTEWPYTGSGKIAKQRLRDTYLPEFATVGA